MMNILGKVLRNRNVQVVIGSAVLAGAGFLIGVGSTKVTEVVEDKLLEAGCDANVARKVSTYAGITTGVALASTLLFAITYRGYCVTKYKNVVLMDKLNYRTACLHACAKELSDTTKQLHTCAKEVIKLRMGEQIVVNALTWIAEDDLVKKGMGSYLRPAHECAEKSFGISFDLSNRLAGYNIPEDIITKMFEVKEAV